MKSRNSIWARLAFAAGTLLCASGAVSAATTDSDKVAAPGTVVQSSGLGAAAANATVTDFQTQAHLNCNPNTHKCAATLAILSPKQMLRLEKAICFVRAPNFVTVFQAYLQYGNGSGGQFYYDLIPQSSTFDGTFFVEHIFDETGPWIVPLGRTLIARVDFTDGATPTGYCTAFGQRYQNP